LLLWLLLPLLLLLLLVTGSGKNLSDGWEVMAVVETKEEKEGEEGWRGRQ